MTTLDRSVSQERQSPDVLSRALAQVYTLNWEAIAYMVIFVVAMFSRFYMLGERVMSHDESLHTRYSFNLATDGNFQHTPLMHGPVLFHFTALFYFLFGASDFTSRLYTAILGVLVVMMPLLFRRWLGRWGALLASIMMLISPITMYYNRYIRHDTPNIFFSLVMIYSIFMYLSGPENQRRRAHWLYILAGAMVMNLGSKETAFIYIFIMGVYLAFYWFVRLYQYFSNRPGKTPFYFTMMAFGVGGVAALGMYVVLSINLGEQPFFTAISTLTSPATFISWTAVVIAFMALFVGATVWVGFRGSRVKLGLVEGVGFTGLSILIAAVLIVTEEASRIPDDEVREAVTVTPIPLVLAIIATVIIIGVMMVTWRRGWWNLMQKEFPEFDLIVLIASLIVPWASPFIIYASGINMTKAVDAYTPTEIQIIALSLLATVAISLTAGLLWNWRKWLISNVIFYALFAFFFTTMFTNGSGVFTGIIGSLGYWLEQQGVRRGSQPQYYYLGLILPMYEYLVVLGSTFAMFGGLVWFWRYRRARLEEDAERYEVLYSEAVNAEVLPAADEMATSDAGDYDSPPAYEPTEPPPQNDNVYLNQLPFLPFVAWWAILNLIGYTLAGEKMPWLAIHMALPMILLTGWFFGRIFQRVDFRRFLNLGWLYLLLLPLAFVLVARLIGPFLFGNVPFTGLEASALRQSGQWFAVAAVLGLVVLGIVQLVERTGWRHLRRMFAVSLFTFLSLLTLRAAWMASFINYDLANEYLVYAHAAPAVKLVLNDIEELSRRTTDGLDIEFVYDNEVSWPYSWYFRDFNNATFTGGSPNAQQVDNAVVAVVGDANRSKFEPLLEDRYYRREYIRLWWPMQDYFGMTPERISDTFDFSDPNAGLVRQGLWDIWWKRDYETYGNALDRNFELTSWPVSDRMHFYIRKDFAAQVWNLGVGDGTVPGLASEVNVCNANWQPVNADVVYGDADITGTLLNPIGAAVYEDRLYVAQQGAGQIAVYDLEGNFIENFGERGSALDVNTGTLFDHNETLGLLERPNGVSVGDDGNIYVADTWNFRVQVFSPDGEAINAWGARNERGAEAQTEPLTGFWGPRDVLAANGKVFVADTGNKRVRVYTSEGEFLYDIGSAGSEDGQLNEPAGLAYHPDGRLYVADTWNRRVAVFNETGEFLYNFRVRAWYNDQGNRPYLGVDPGRGYVYVSDPEAARVLVYDLEGNCVGSFGQPAADENAGTNQLGIAGGISVDDASNVYVVDSRIGRVLRFPPFPLPEELPNPVDDSGDEVIVEPLEPVEQIGQPEGDVSEIELDVPEGDSPVNPENSDPDISGIDPPADE